VEPGSDDAVRDLERRLAEWERGWPPGHFYSPLPDLAQVREREQTIFRVPPTVPGVALNAEGQLSLLEQLAVHYPSQPFADRRQAGLRYAFDNPNFTHGEAIVLFCMMALLRPKRIIEVGSGYSSCVILDTDETVLGRGTDCTFIEPHPELFLTLLEPGDTDRITLIGLPIQEVDLDRFRALENGDILFIDSSHVSKVGSDVNWIVFEILPVLAEGVYIHFHDVGYPFEYPKEWIYQGRAWNEAYLLRAFLQFNEAFTIMFFNSFLGQCHAIPLGRALPLASKNPGTSLWLRKGPAAAPR
jgi:hypothetical protein